MYPNYLPFDNNKTRNYLILPNIRGLSAATAYYDLQEVYLPDCNMVYIFCLGAGAGGNGGTTPGAVAGGGGGGSGSMSKNLIPRIFLPASIWVQAGRGGLGGAVNTRGNYGGDTYVTMRSNDKTATSTANGGVETLCYASGGQSNTTLATGGAGGTVASAANTAAGVFFGFNPSATSLAGSAGGAGGASAANGSTVTYPTTGILCSGGGGGGGAGNTSGGATSGNSYVPATQAAGIGVDGQNGFCSFGNIPLYTTILGGGEGIYHSGITAPANGATTKGIPMMAYVSSGGGGGGGASAAQAGKGGRGGWGSGGGGGGASTAGGTSGEGGDGGHGFVFISCW